MDGIVLRSLWVWFLLEREASESRGCVLCIVVVLVLCVRLRAHLLSG